MKLLASLNLLEFIYMYMHHDLLDLLDFHNFWCFLVLPIRYGFKDYVRILRVHKFSIPNHSEFSVCFCLSLNCMTSVAVDHVNREQRHGVRVCVNRSKASGSHPQDIASVAFGDEGRAAAVLEARYIVDNH